MLNTPITIQILSKPLKSIDYKKRMYTQKNIKNLYK